MAVKWVWWYLSFSDPERPVGTQFLGGLFLQGSDLEDVVTRSHRLGLNPGGEIQTVEFPAGLKPDPVFCNRLLTRAEVKAVPEPQWT